MTAPSISAEQCTATAKATGLRCQRLVLGGGVCIMHGGRAPQVARKREERVALAEAQLRDPVAFTARTPGEALLAVAQDSDLTLQQIKGMVGEARDRGEGLSAAEIMVLGEWMDRVARINKLAIDPKVDEALQAQASRRASEIIGLVRLAVDLARAEPTLTADHVLLRILGES